MGNSVTIVVPDEFNRWVSGLSSMELNAEDALFWDQAADYMFSETQRLVHVLSGDLKRSGRQIHAELQGQEVVVGIEYGGVPGLHHQMVDYAGYELARGGSHDFITPAALAAERVFGERIIDMAMSMVVRSIGG